MNRTARTIAHLVLALSLAWSPLTFAGMTVHMKGCEAAAAAKPAGAVVKVSPLAQLPAGKAPGLMTQDQCQQAGHDCAVCVVCFTLHSSEPAVSVAAQTLPAASGVRPLPPFNPLLLRPPISYALG